MARCYDFGVAPGPHDEPWSAAYHREAVYVYAEALPMSYQIEIESLFRHCADMMNEGTIPADMAEHWVIVKRYLSNVADEIALMLAAQGILELSETSLDEVDMSGDPPPVVQYDRLAALTTLGGAQRLENAAAVVREHVVGGTGAIPLDDEQRRLLKGVSDGVSIADLADQLGYSRRTIFRALSRLWDTLGVPDRAHGLRKAARDGLLDMSRN